ncbi:catalase family protein [Streptomyces diastatochromogenes]|uniref:catalase family protein n=1 Tax=Streptomyces diastatochromogenes TaxID=42236 RepID=UPI00364A1333
MSSEFVRYTPEIETIDPQIDELLAQIIGFWEKKARESPRREGTGRAVRGAHAKSFGVVKAEVEILADVPAAYAQGIYAKPGHHGALIRFSSTSGHLGTDAQLGAGLGFAIKIFDVDGRKLVDDEPDSGTFDLVLKNCPIFISNTAKHYLFIEDIVNNAQDYLTRGKPGLHELLSDVLTGKGQLDRQEWAWDELFALVRTTQTPVRNPLLTTFWTMGAVRHGDYVAKIRVAPKAESATHVIHRDLDLTSGPEVFHPTLADELQARAFDFDLQVQLCTDINAMPVNDLTVEWPEKLSPFVTVGRVHLPRQDISGPENFEKGDALAFNQWRVTSDHRPLGEIMKVRRIYSASAKVRRTLNHQPQSEPTSADSVLP